MSTDCKLTARNNSAYCVGAIVEDGVTSSMAQVIGGYLDFLMPVTLTAGLEKLPAATGSPTEPANTDAITTPAPTGTGAPTDDSDDSSDGNDESSDGNDKSTEEPGSTSTSTGGVARITQNAIALGAAALFGGALFI
jgi:hypothetical protein